MEIRQFRFDKQLPVNLISRANAMLNSWVARFFSFFKRNSKAPYDFSMRADIPSLEEYKAATPFQILDRLNRNPCGLESEKAFVNFLINVRNAENNRKLANHVVAGTYILAIAAILLVYLAAHTPSAPQEKSEGQPIVQQQVPQQELENTVSLLKQEFNQKLQTKDIEVRDLKRQVGFLTQAQAELAKHMKAIPKNAGAAAASTPASKPKKPNDVTQGR